MLNARAVAVSLAGTALLTGSALVRVPANALPEQPVIDSVATPSSAHGSNLLLRAQADPNFCLQVEAGTLQGRMITLQQCSTAQEQRWALTWNQDGSNTIVDIQGMCLDARLRTSDGVPVAVRNCRFGDAWQYVVTPEGRIVDVQTGRCVDVGGIAAGAAAYLVPCDENRSTQRWKLTR